MLIVAALTFALQWVEPRPSHTEVGSAVTIVARSTDGAPIVDLAIEVRWPDGRVETIGRTDGSGEVEFAPSEPGPYRVTARHAGVVMHAPLRAVRSFSRGWYALACVPLGLWLLWRNLRRRSG